MAFRVEQERYQGPLDLLVSLSLERDLPLEDISLAALAQDFRAQIAAAADIELGEVGDFAVLCARLIRLKAGWDRTFAETQDRDEAMPAAEPPSGEMLRGAAFLRGRQRQALFRHPSQKTLASHRPEALLSALHNTNRRARLLGVRARLRPRPRLAFRRVLAALRRALRGRDRVEVGSPERSRREAVLEVLGALELTRLGEAVLEQDRFYEPLYLAVRKEVAAATHKIE